MRREHKNTAAIWWQSDCHLLERQKDCQRAKHIELSNRCPRLSLQDRTRQCYGESTSLCVYLYITNIWMAWTAMTSWECSIQSDVFQKTLEICGVIPHQLSHCECLHPLQGGIKASTQRKGTLSWTLGWNSLGNSLEVWVKGRENPSFIRWDTSHQRTDRHTLVSTWEWPKAWDVKGISKKKRERKQSMSASSVVFTCAKNALPVSTLQCSCRSLSLPPKNGSNTDPESEKEADLSIAF